MVRIYLLWQLQVMMGVNKLRDCYCLVQARPLQMRDVSQMSVISLFCERIVQASRSSCVAEINALSLQSLGACLLLAVSR